MDSAAAKGPGISLETEYSSLTTTHHLAPTQLPTFGPPFQPETPATPTRWVTRSPSNAGMHLNLQPTRSPHASAAVASCRCSAACCGVALRRRLLGHVA